MTPRLHYWFALAASLSVLWVSDPAHAASTSCTLERYTTVDIEFPPAGLVTLPVTIKGETMRMALHTSATFSILNEAVTRRLQLPTTPIDTNVDIRTGEDRVTKFVSVPEIAIGGLRIKNTQMLVSANPIVDEPHTSPDSVVGTLGFGLFRNIDVEIDFPKRKLSLYSSYDCDATPVYWSNHYAVIPMKRDETVGATYFEMELDGRKLQTSLSTGSRVSGLNSAVAKKVFGFDESTPDVTTRDTLGGAGLLPPHVAYGRRCIHHEHHCVFPAEPFGLWSRCAAQSKDCSPAKLLECLPT